MKPHALQWTSLPLERNALIEASAGTGKTYTITLLYLRLLLERGLSVRQILVCTFTDAATEELRERVRQRIDQTERLLRSATVSDGSASELSDWLQQMIEASKDNGALLRRRLRLAQLELDQAAIFTLHGFCQRVLTDLPLEGESLLARGDLIDETELLSECLTDFFRREFAVDEPDWPHELRSIDIAALLRQVAPALQQRDAELLPVGSSLELEYRTLWNAFCASNPTESLRRVLDGQPVEYALNKKFSGALESALAAVHSADWRWAIDSALSSDPPDPPQDKRKLGSGKVTSVADVTAIASLQKIADLRPDLVRECRGRLLVAAIDYARREIPRRALLQRGYTYSDLIDNLLQALQGPQAETLTVRIQQRWPIALIDEFQDIDPRQYRILQKVYAGLGNLLMIGDPKQAIYAFRGGDVHAYLRVARSAGMAMYTLATNWRSSPQLVDTVNHFYAAAGADALQIPGIEYQPVKAGRSDRANALTHSGTAVTQTLMFHSVVAHSSALADLDEACLSACADAIVGLLNDRDLCIDQRPVAPDSIAVLLPRNGDIVQLRKLLRHRGVPCVGAGRSNVLESPAAQEIERLLTALVDCRDETRLRGVLTGRLYGWGLTALERCNGDPEVWAGQIDAFVELFNIWKRDGVMAALDRVIAQAAPRLLAADDGERFLTDLRHVAELLQEQSARSPGDLELLAWLRHERTSPDGSTDASEQRQLRIETDSKRVQLLTVHASKGLEFDIVLLPQLWRTATRTGRYAPDSVLVHDSEGLAVIDTGSTHFENNLQKWHGESLAERLRQQYVALTRARLACHVFIPESICATLGSVPPDTQSGALTWHLQTVAQHQPAANPDPFSRLCDLSSGIGFRAAQPGYARRYEPAVAIEAAPLIARTDLPSARDDWSMHSFSSIAHDKSAHAATAFDDKVPDDASGNDDALINSDDLDASAHPDLLALADWRGPTFGNMLHRIFETTDPAVPVLPQQAHRLHGALRQYGYSTDGNAAMLRAVADVVDRARRCDLGAGLRLADVAAPDAVAEFEFHLPLQRLRPAKLAALCAEHGYPEAVPIGTDRSIEGLLKGYIDLVLRRNGQYFVLDYKSNWLGDRIGDYAPPSLRKSMDAAYYTLQSILYSVALHRHLTQRLNHYDYDAHFGGTIYLYVRGAGLAPAAGVHQDLPPRQLVESIDALFAGTETVQ